MTDSFRNNLYTKNTDLQMIGHVVL